MLRIKHELAAYSNSQFATASRNQRLQFRPWEDSAIDALKFDNMTGVTKWTLPVILFKLEGFNGFGYRTRHHEVLTPYLWSFTNHYLKGKFTADGKFDPNAVSKQWRCSDLKSFNFRGSSPACGLIERRFAFGSSRVLKRDFLVS